MKKVLLAIAATLFVITAVVSAPAAPQVGPNVCIRHPNRPRCHTTTTPTPTPTTTTTVPTTTTTVPPPPGCTGVAVPPGTTSGQIQTLVNNNVAHTTFCFDSATYVMTSGVNTGTKAPVFDFRAGSAPDAVIDGNNGDFMGFNCADSTDAGFDALGGVFQHFGNLTTAPDWASPLRVCDDGLVDGGEFRFNANTGLGTCGDRAVIRNAYIHDNGRYGFVETGCNVGSPDPVGTLIENNEISFNNTRHLAPDNDAGGTKWSAGVDIIIRGNNVHDNYGSGIWVDWGEENFQIYGNTVTHNGSWGIFWEASGAARIHDNVVSGNGTLAGGTYNSGQIEATCKTGTTLLEIDHNTVTAAPLGIVLLNYDRSGADGTCQIRNAWVHDNDVFLPGGSGQRTGGWDDRTQAPVNSLFDPANNNRFENNHYHVAALADTHWAWNDNQNSTFAQWQAIFPTDTRTLI